MRTEDLNNDGESDCVGLHVQDLRIITDPRISVESLGKDLFRNGQNTLLNFIDPWVRVQTYTVLQKYTQFCLFLL